MSDAVMIALITGGATVVTGVGVAYINYNLGKIHKQINSRMDELLKISKEASKAEGKLEGKEEEKQENKKPGM